MRDYESVIKTIGRDIIPKLGRDFPDERLGVADKFLISIVARNTINEFDEKGKPLRHWGFLSAVGTDSERMFGYKCRKEFYELQ